MMMMFLNPENKQMKRLPKFDMNMFYDMLEEINMRPEEVA